MQGKEVTIYTLSHPVTKEVFYIGRTCSQLQRRLGNHNLSAKMPIRYVTYLKWLTDNKLRPVIEPLETCLKKEGKKIEEFWIQTFSSWGFPLTNIKHVKNKSFYGIYKRKYNRSYKNISLDANMVELIRRLYNPKDCAEIGKQLGCTPENIRIILVNKIGRSHSVKLAEWAKDCITSYYLNKGKLISEVYLKIKNNGQINS